MSVNVAAPLRLILVHHRIRLCYPILSLDSAVPVIIAVPLRVIVVSVTVAVHLCVILFHHRIQLCQFSCVSYSCCSSPRYPIPSPDSTLSVQLCQLQLLFLSALSYSITGFSCVSLVVSITVAAPHRVVLFHHRIQLCQFSCASYSCCSSPRYPISSPDSVVSVTVAAPLRVILFHYGIPAVGRCRRLPQLCLTA